ncbi:hypothetical protein ACFL6X_02415 [Candidatus Latescibacterota bacterium]
MAAIPHHPLLTIDTPMAPPRWALLERQLLATQAEGCRQFYDKYFDERGYLECIPRWGGNDGADDAAENQLNWTMLHALGGDDDILDLFRKGFEGHLKQYTEAKTVEVPFARDGMYFREWPVSLDWFHHGEGYSAFLLYGLSDPYDLTYLQRCRRYAAMYMGEDPTAPNYDPEHRIIRSMFNGSRGPLLRKATQLDWAGDPIQVEGRFDAGHGERTFAEMLAHYDDYTDVVGDHPLNLEATHLGVVNTALGGEDKYRDWMLEYVDAWVERCDDNNGIIPSNIGLDGTIGGEVGGKWYGGCYGWGFTVVVPQTGALSNRPACYARPHYGFSHGLLMTGKQSYVDTWRGVIEAVNANAKEVEGQTMYPHMHGDEGWYDFRPTPFSSGALEVWYWSQSGQDRERVKDNGWVSYLAGDNPSYPERALESDLERLRTRMERMRADTSTPDTRLSDDMNSTNPATIENLNQLMLGGLPVGRSCHTLHCRLRYFDPARQRAGLPPDVGALVESMTDDSVTVSLVNLSPVDARTVVVQGGAYAEHRFRKVTVDDRSMEATGAGPSDGSAFSVRLEPGCGAQLRMGMQRYAHQPTFLFPWDRS